MNGHTFVVVLASASRMDRREEGRPGHDFDAVFSRVMGQTLNRDSASGTVTTLPKSVRKRRPSANM